MSVVLSTKLVIYDFVIRYALLVALMSCMVSSLYKKTLYFTSRMISSNCSYEEAMHKLNNLQSNRATIDQIRRDIKTGKKCTNLEDMENYLIRTGVPLSMLDNMSVIHIAGTKGKGSTSAMCESVLRHHGYKTGFFSSPHLVSVCERIRLNGQIITKKKFSENFHSIYNLLEQSQMYENDMPKYFAFLTVLAYNIFLKEKVDVAIIEVGIGGVVDYTNIVRNVPIVGITALGLDHTSILGNTIEEIALAKAGIMKPGCETYTVHQQPNAMNVLHKVAAEIQCPLHVVPDYKTYHFPNKFKTKQLPIELEAYCMNASLAIQLAHAWMRLVPKNTHNSKKKDTNGSLIDTYLEKNKQNGKIIYDLPVNTILGLMNCQWPGRYQIINLDNIKFYLDGAHTKESMEICAKWFKHQSGNKQKCLIFSATGDRDALTLLLPLKNINFEQVFCVIPTAYKDVSDKNDNYTILEQRELLSRCHANAKTWREMCNPESNVIVYECVADAIKQIRQTQNNLYCSVLITGSLHLVGAALSIVDKNLSNI